ncbi:hypothetical protein Acsp01_07370 [Actinoplanes sp. NBRC 101535]|nr:hypothetical protein Acsp01_07370 [Actinoplanes sp. NBRC 101535]
MAARLYISPNTVKSRLKTLYQQLGARDQAHAVAIAFRMGVLRAADEPDDPNVQPIVVGGLNPDRLRTTIADLTALLRIAEKAPASEENTAEACEGCRQVLKYVAELARQSNGNPSVALDQIVQIVEAANGR